MNRIDDSFDHDIDAIWVGGADVVAQLRMAIDRSITSVVASTWKAGTRTS
jgi:hypothetical protein